MAIIAPNITLMGSNSITMEWTPLTTADSGGAWDCSHKPDKTIQVFGTFGTGGSVTVYGSNSADDVGVEPSHANSTWIPLKDTQDNDITKTAEGGDIIAENYKYIACDITAGDGATSLTVAVTASS